MQPTSINWKEYGKIALLSFLLGGLISTVALYLGTEAPGWQRTLRFFSYSGLLTLVLMVGNSLIADTVPISWVEQPVKRLWVSLSLTVVYTIAAVAVVHGLFNWAVWGNSPVRAVKNIDPTFFVSALVITFLISLFMHGRAFLFHWKNAIVEAERLQQAHLSSRFESLKNQVNPHFLFNSLNVLSGLVYKDADLAARFIKKLAEVYRYILDTREREVVPLQTELEALEAYIFLLQIRFGDNLKVEIDLPAAAGNAVLPPLSLQMLLENAVKHNIASRAQPLWVRIFQSAGHYITVQNNLQRKHNEQESNGIGLANIQERYRYFSDKPVQIKEEDATFSVSVPLIEMQP
ncbi:MAG: histidine kinase [Saprospiraceae bacterium]|nr:histidine kinase [Saprospiraceae bacterium]